MRPIRSSTRRWRITTSHLWALVTLVGIFAFLNTHPIRPQDFWWHLAIGRDIATSGRIPTTDTYSFTAYGTPYASYQMFWLPELSFYLWYRLGGPALVVFAHSLLVTLAYALTLRLTYEHTRNWRIAAITTLFAAALGINDWNVRPQAFTFWLMPLFLLAINRYRERGQHRWLALLPLGSALWVNCHGTYILGLGLIGLWLVDDVWEVLTTPQADQTPSKVHPILAPFVVLVVTAMACLINPRGLGIVAYVRDLSSDPTVQGLVTEWAAPSFSTFHGGAFLIGLLGTATVLALSPHRPSASQMLTFLAFGGLALRTSRGIIWFGLVLAPILADHLAAIRTSWRVRGTGLAGPNRQYVTLNALIAMLLILGAIISLPWFKSFLSLPAAKADLISRETPVEATEFLLDTLPAGPLFHDMGFGSYLIWAAQPDYHVFVDPRIELYPLDLWLDYLRISTARWDWEERLVDYGVHTLMLSPATQAPLVEAARHSTNWREVYTDHAAVILTLVQ